jgi:hypothetical protein
MPPVFYPMVLVLFLRQIFLINGLKLHNEDFHAEGQDILLPV